MPLKLTINYPETLPNALQQPQEQFEQGAKMAKREGYLVSMQQAIECVRNRGIRLSETVVTFALEQAGESDIS